MNGRSAPGASEADFPWASVVTAYRHQVRNRRDPERLDALRQAAATSGLDAAITTAFQDVCRGHEPDFEVAQALSWVDAGERLAMLALLFEHCAPLNTVALPCDGVIAGNGDVARTGIAVDGLCWGDGNHAPDPHVLLITRVSCATGGSP